MPDLTVIGSGRMRYAKKALAVVIPKEEWARMGVYGHAHPSFGMTPTFFSFIIIIFFKSVSYQKI